MADVVPCVLEFGAHARQVEGLPARFGDISGNPDPRAQRPSRTPLLSNLTAGQRVTAIVGRTVGLWVTTRRQTVK